MFDSILSAIFDVIRPISEWVDYAKDVYTN